DQHVVEGERFARTCVVLDRHRQLRSARKGTGPAGKGLKLPVARGSSPCVTARFCVGVGRLPGVMPIPRAFADGCYDLVNGGECLSRGCAMRFKTPEDAQAPP